MAKAENKKQILREVEAALPYMSEEQKGFFRGYAAAMADRQDDEARQRDPEEKETA